MSKPCHGLIADHPFPAYHKLTKEELRNAYLWELDREFLEDGEDLRLPWPLLWDGEKAVIKPNLGKPIQSEDIPPVAAKVAFPPSLIEAFRTACEITKKPEVDSGSAIWGCGEEFWREARDCDGWRIVAFQIRANASLEDICAAIKNELEKLRLFEPKIIPPKGLHWDSQLFDLLCLRLERQGKSWSEAAKITRAFQSAFSIPKLDAKIWSTRRGRARKAISKRRSELEDLRKREMLKNLDMWSPLSSFGAQGLAGCCEVGRRHPADRMGPLAEFFKGKTSDEMRLVRLRIAEGKRDIERRFSQWG